MPRPRVPDVIGITVYRTQGKDQRALLRMDRNRNERRRRYKISPKSCSLKFFVAQTSIKVGVVLYEQLFKTNSAHQKELKDVRHYSSG